MLHGYGGHILHRARIGRVGLRRGVRSASHMDIDHEGQDKGEGHDAGDGGPFYGLFLRGRPSVGEALSQQAYSSKEVNSLTISACAGLLL